MYGPSPLTFRVADPERRYAAVRLCSDLPLSDAERSFGRDGDEWVLEIDAPAIERLEYHLEVVDAYGGTQTGPDPGNPLRAPGAFGEKSVLLLPGYEPPAWLEADAVEGAYRDFAVRGRGLGANVTGWIWSPPGPSTTSRCRCSSPTTGPSTTSSRASRATRPP